MVPSLAYTHTNTLTNTQRKWWAECVWCCLRKKLFYSYIYVRAGVSGSEVMYCQHLSTLDNRPLGGSSSSWLEWGHQSARGRSVSGGQKYCSVSRCALVLSGQNKSTDSISVIPGGGQKRDYLLLVPRSSRSQVKPIDWLPDLLPADGWEFNFQSPWPWFSLSWEWEHNGILSLPFRKSNKKKQNRKRHNLKDRCIQIQYNLNGMEWDHRWHRPRNPLSPLQALHYFLWTTTLFLADDPERKAENSCLWEHKPT